MNVSCEEPAKCTIAVLNGCQPSEGYAVGWKCLVFQFLEFSRPKSSLSELSNISLSPETAGTGNNAMQESNDIAFLQNLLQICIKASLLFLIKLASYYAEIFMHWLKSYS